MKGVILVHSLFNLILALQIRNSIYCDEPFDIVLFDTSEGMNRIYKIGYLNNIFDNIYFVRTKKKISKIRKSIYKYASFLSPQYGIKKILGINKITIYTDIFCWNPDDVFYHFCRYYNFKKRKYNIHLYADALGGFYIDYPHESPKYKIGLLNWIDKKIFKYEFIKNMDYDYYMFSPQFFVGKTERKLIEIPKIEKVELLNQVFGYEKALMPNEKFILIDESEDIKIDEEKKKEFILRIKKILGNNNFIIKLHPRTRVDYYDDFDIKVMENTIPWEIYCANNEVDDKVLIVHSSSAALLPIILFGKIPKIYVYFDILEAKIKDADKSKEMYELMAEQTDRIIFFKDMETLEQQFERDISELEKSKECRI